nr:MAG TPA: hypothetical protein [Bacteriophage sp.]
MIQKVLYWLHKTFWLFVEYGKFINLVSSNLGCSKLREDLSFLFVVP